LVRIVCFGDVRRTGDSAFALAPAPCQENALDFRGAKRTIEQLDLVDQAIEERAKTCVRRASAYPQLCIIVETVGSQLRVEVEDRHSINIEVSPGHAGSNNRDGHMMKCAIRDISRRNKV